MSARGFGLGVVCIVLTSLGVGSVRAEAAVFNFRCGQQVTRTLRHPLPFRFRLAHTAGDCAIHMAFFDAAGQPFALKDLLPGQRAWVQSNEHMVLSASIFTDAGSTGATLSVTAFAPGNVEVIPDQTCHGQKRWEYDNYDRCPPSKSFSIQNTGTCPIIITNQRIADGNDANNWSSPDITPANRSIDPMNGSQPSGRYRHLQVECDNSTTHIHCSFTVQ
ncbi:MAG: hypothetical protein HYR85_02510 [Planctomycetes bacterium]|nr:hypothetical protein [Planctomycetota bacterium]MBI3845464.1 hypothetical protein [Planctomycetota bacterium]